MWEWHALSGLRHRLCEQYLELHRALCTLECIDHPMPPEIARHQSRKQMRERLGLGTPLLAGAPGAN